MLDASSEALATARMNWSDATNISFHHASVSDIPLPDGSLDFAYSLGVLHHVPDTVGAMKHICIKLKPGAPFLVYLYYALDNRPWWFRSIWKATNVTRRGISKLPASLKLIASQLIAAIVYWPIARLCTMLASFGVSTTSIPLEAYKDRSFYTMRTDAYDRFCTVLEKRFTKSEIEEMLLSAGFERVVFSDKVPYWCALAYRVVN
jgi:ubiquinone/menaquinone biosynthesis C-methylase UbiE